MIARWSGRINLLLALMPAFGSVANPIAMMEAEHQEAGDALERIRELSNDHKAPKGACNTFRMVYGELKDFADDLHQHIHLENNILFPKAQELEKGN